MIKLLKSLTRVLELVEEAERERPRNHAKMVDLVKIHEKLMADLTALIAVDQVPHPWTEQQTIRMRMTGLISCPMGHFNNYEEGEDNIRVVRTGSEWFAIRNKPSEDFESKSKWISQALEEEKGANHLLGWPFFVCQHDDHSKEEIPMAKETKFFWPDYDLIEFGEMEEDDDW